MAFSGPSDLKSTGWNDSVYSGHGGNLDPRLFTIDQNATNDEPGVAGSDPDYRLTTTSAPQQAKKDGWERHRQRITKLYSKKPLKEVVTIMEQEHNFVATKRMYKARFKEWGIRKNVTVGQVVDATLGAQRGSYRQVNQQQLCTQNLGPLPHSDRMDTTNGPGLDQIERYVRRKPTGLIKLPTKDRERAEAYFGLPKIRRAYREATNVPMTNTEDPLQSVQDLWDFTNIPFDNNSIYSDQNQGVYTEEVTTKATP
jgi:hypothetical protein